MKNRFLATLVLALAAGSSQAQLRKCTAPDGKVTYSDVLCSTTSKSAQTIEAMQAPARSSYQAQPAQQSQAALYEREISGKIGSHLLQNNYERAEALATTPEHYQMIADARRDKQNYELDKKAAARAARPTVCRSFGVSNGYVNNYGYGSTYSGVNHGTTVCNK